MDDIKHGRNPYGAAAGNQTAQGGMAYTSTGGAGGFGDWDDIHAVLRHGRADSYSSGFAPLARIQVPNVARCGKHNHRIAARRICGRQKTIRLDDGKTVDFNLPAGVLAGDRIKLTGLGRTGPDGRKGNRILQVEIAKDDELDLNGLDVTMSVSVTPWTAALGGKIDVRPFDRRITVQIPANSRGGQRLKVRGQGYRDRQGRRGDLYLKLEIQNPSYISSEMRDLYQKLCKYHTLNSLPLK